MIWIAGFLVSCIIVYLMMYIWILGDRIEDLKVELGMTRDSHANVSEKLQAARALISEIHRLSSEGYNASDED